MTATMKFKIVRGSAEVDGKLYKANTANNIIETASDLAAQHNSPGSVKFQPVVGNPRPEVFTEEVELPDGPTQEQLKNMNEEELLEYAMEHEVDLGNAKTEEGIRKKIWRQIGIDS